MPTDRAKNPHAWAVFGRPRRRPPVPVEIITTGGEVIVSLPERYTTAVMAIVKAHNATLGVRRTDGRRLGPRALPREKGAGSSRLAARS
jgi:hypothetical protein